MPDDAATGAAAPDASAAKRQTQRADDGAPKLDAAPTDPATPDFILFLGLYLVALTVAVLYALTVTWPEVADGKIAPRSWPWCSTCQPLSLDGQLLFLVATAGALGSLVHVMTSFADFVGNKRLGKSWIWWLILRTPIGSALAVIVYLVLRGGLITSSGANSFNYYGLAAAGAMAGMFSKQATDKLSEVFDTLFHARQEVARAGQLNPNETKPAAAAQPPPKAAPSTPAPSPETPASDRPPGAQSGQ